MKPFIITIAFAIVVIFVAVTNAALIDNLDGTVTQIRNDGSRLMWFKDANYAATSNYSPDGSLPDPGWHSDEQTIMQDYIDSLNQRFGPTPGTFGYAGYNDWRIPSPIDRDGVTICYGYNCNENELGYMYYTELGNVASPDGGGLMNTGPFVNLMVSLYDISYGYWAGLGGSFFSFDTGQIGYYVYPPGVDVGPQPGFVWPVRDMDPIPIPGAIWLLGSGLIGIVGMRRKFKS